MADHTAVTAAGASPFTGWAGDTPAESYSTGQRAHSGAQTAAITMTTGQPHRQRGEGRWPSGKQKPESVVSARATPPGPPPSHAHHWLASSEGVCAPCRPRNVTASTTPVA